MLYPLSYEDAGSPIVRYLLTVDRLRSTSVQKAANSSEVSSAFAAAMVFAMSRNLHRVPIGALKARQEIEVLWARDLGYLRVRRDTPVHLLPPFWAQSIGGRSCDEADDQSQPRARKPVFGLMVLADVSKFSGAAMDPASRDGVTNYAKTMVVRHHACSDKPDAQLMIAHMERTLEDEAEDHRYFVVGLAGGTVRGAYPSDEEPAAAVSPASCLKTECRRTYQACSITPVRRA